MGTANAEEHSNESPQNLVRIDQPFYIGRFPVTQGQWRAVMGASDVGNGLSDLPVDQVSWLDCQKFCEELCKRHRRAFRLPSEAEWEYACRAGTTTKFTFGDSLTVEQANFTPFKSTFGALPEDEIAAVQELDQLADRDVDEQADRRNRPTPVGTYAPNAWGIYDMHGNVEEWCEDVWHDNYEGAPTDGSPWLAGGDKQPFRVLRGGCCTGTEFVCTSASRRRLRADAGSRKVTEPENDREHEWLLSAMFGMMYTPYGFRVVCEV